MELTKFKTIGKNIVGGLYNIDKYNKFAIENCIKWLKGEPFERQDEDGKKKQGKFEQGIMIAGPCGTGKSLIMKILKKFALDEKIYMTLDGKKIRANWMTYHANQLCNLWRNGQDLGFLMNSPIVQIDDLGAEPETCQYMGNKLNPIQEVLEVRADKPVLTLITTNLNMDSIEDRYGERLASRLAMLNYFILKGEDYRQK